MYNKKEFKSFSEKCNDICENNPPKEAVKKMAELKMPDAKKQTLGVDRAVKIYVNVYVDSKVKYDVDKHKNNFSEFQKERMKYLEPIYCKNKPK